MKINVTGRSDAVTSAMKRKAADKFGKLQRFFDRITWVEVKLDAQNERKTVEVSAGLNRGATIVSKTQENDMYAAIDIAVDKMTRQLRRHKEKLSDKRPRRSEPTPPPEPDDEDS